MAATVYILGALSSLFCAMLLIRHFLTSRTRLLLWSAVCFCGLTATNILVFIDLVSIPDIDLHLLRWGIAAASLGFMVFGLVWESR